MVDHWGNLQSHRSSSWSSGTVQHPEREGGCVRTWNFSSETSVCYTVCDPNIPCCAGPCPASSYHRPGAVHFGRAEVGLFPPEPEGWTGQWSGRQGLDALPGKQQGEKLSQHFNSKCVDADDGPLYIVVPLPYVRVYNPQFKKSLESV